jgi:hypothetical protein
MSARQRNIPDLVVQRAGLPLRLLVDPCPVLDAQAAPVHHRGVTSSQGLYFLGMKNQYSRGSSLIGWVRNDAAYIVEHIRGTRARRA